MACSSNQPLADTVSYRGEVWTDGFGYATVRLPAGGELLETPLEYELRDVEPPTSARVPAELEHGRFTIRTGQARVVAWRISGRQAAGQSRHRQQEEE